VCSYKPETPEKRLKNHYAVKIAREVRMEDLFTLVYAELRKIAGRQLRGERVGHTLCTTALVHEAWFELTKLNRIRWQNRAHFLALASQAMRRVLVDYAVARRAQKRGGGKPMESLDGDALAVVQERADDLLMLDEALQRLQAVNDYHARIVECRFYGGMSIEETAEALEVSPATLKRDWALARAWLNRELASE
jgi:RNA polymerase sigma factor (TIGR02999 family)